MASKPQGQASIKPLDVDGLRHMFVPGAVEKVNAHLASTADAPLGASRFRMLLRKANVAERRTYFPQTMELVDYE
jgi:hypothetical protein